MLITVSLLMIYTTMNCIFIVAAPPRKDDDQQKMEEETNHLDNDFNFSAVKSEKAVAAGFISHPGILAGTVSIYLLDMFLSRILF